MAASASGAEAGPAQVERAAVAMRRGPSPYAASRLPGAARALRARDDGGAGAGAGAGLDARAVVAGASASPLQAELRRALLDETRLTVQVDASLVQAKRVLPMKDVFVSDLAECRARMQRAIVAALAARERGAVRVALRHWRQVCRDASAEEQRQRALTELALKRAASLEGLAKLARRALKGKRRVLFEHWRHVARAQTQRARAEVREAAARTLQRVARGLIARRRARRE